jgi:hypothetical protein
MKRLLPPPHVDAVVKPGPAQFETRQQRRAAQRAALKVIERVERRKAERARVAAKMERADGSA